MAFQKEKQFTKELFKNPTSEYRGAPFWAWNCELDKETLDEQIGYFKEMGFGGYHMHVRTGMKTPYMGEEFLDDVKYCIERGKEREMLSWLYDEDRWPSGAAGGMVTKDVENRVKYLIFTTQSYEERAIEAHKAKASEYITVYHKGRKKGKNITSHTIAECTGKGKFIGCYDVVLGKDGTMESYQMVEKDASAKGTKWYVYMESPEGCPWYNNQTYVDTMSKKAIQKFIETTHEKYKGAIGDEFGKAVPAIFTDEPQMTHKSVLNYAADADDIFIPWTTDFNDTFKEAYGEGLVEHLPELIWDLPKGMISVSRYHYHDHLGERFAGAFADTLGDWCKENGLMLTGHMMYEPTLKSQTTAVSEAMRSYRSFDFPGIDMLCNFYEYTTAKQAQSATHQAGNAGILSELYGVTNWDFDFRGHKLQGDWQAALGVTVRVQHLSWVSMAGEAKRDYPATLNYQVPWYKEYKIIEDHFSRVHTAMTQGDPDVKIGVVHPIESYWLHWGPEENTALIREEKDKKFEDITEWLLFGQNDFDFICESLLPDQRVENDPMAVGKMKYSVILVPGMETIRSTTIDFLTAYANAGGKVIVVGEYPSYVDAKVSDKLEELKKISVQIPYEKVAVYEAMLPYKNISIRDINGMIADNLIYQMRKDGENKWLFIVNGNDRNNADGKDLPDREDVKIYVYGGEYDVEVFDTLTGDTYRIPAKTEDGMTVINYTFYQHDSLLVHLTPKKAEAFKVNETKAEAVTEELPVADLVPITLAEPNVLMLDQAEFALDDEEYQPKEEILRLDNVLRERFGWPTRMDSVAQPYVIPKEEITHKARLRFEVYSEIDVTGAALAIEDAEVVKIVLNGETVPSVVTGWYVDKSIKTVALPEIKAGKNILEVEIPFGKSTNIEWCYILGDFGVRVNGRRCTITPPVREVGFGDLSVQGLPFYGGNVTYHIDVETDTDKLEVHAPQYRGALLGAGLNGEDRGRIIFAPYTITMDGCRKGKNTVDITLYGSRVNTFGCIHNCNPGFFYHGPDCYRSTGDEWTYNYVLQPTGLLIPPTIKKVIE